MSIKGFSVGGVVQRYDYTALDNLPQGQGVSDDLKAALLQLAQKVAYINDQGQTYYDDLYNALYPERTLLSITANFQQGQAVIYNTDSLDTLKQYLTVTAVYDDASTELVPSSAYTLSGTLTPGTSVITVTYEGKTDAFGVTVTAAPMSFTVTNNLTGCTTSNSATAVLEGTSYTAVITASSDYTLVGATVSITMGGQDITASAYSGGIITINNVAGALVISVAAVAVVLNSISAVYTQSGTVYDTDTLDSLKADLVVTAHYSDSSTQTVPAADYTLSGTLAAGTSAITVSYGGKTTAFNVTVTSIVPAEYKQVQYVESSGTQILATDIIPRNTRTIITFEFTQFPASTDNVVCAVFNANNMRYLVAFLNSNGNFMFQNRSNQVKWTGPNHPTGKHTVDFNNASHQALYDGEVKATDSNFAISSGDSKFTMFARGYTGTINAFGWCRIYACEVINNDSGDTIGNFIPCYRKADGEIGMYDLISQNFYSNTGTGEFTKGPETWGRES